MVGKVLAHLVNYRKIASIAILVLVINTQLMPLQTSGIGEEPDSISRQAFQELKGVAAQIQEIVPKGCSILQLPIMAFPEGGQVEGVGNGEHLWLPLLTKGFRWSYGAPKGSQEGDFWINLSKSDEDGYINEAIKRNFCAVVRNKLELQYPLSPYSYP